MLQTREKLLKTQTSDDPLGTPTMRAQPRCWFSNRPRFLLTDGCDGRRPVRIRSPPYFSNVKSKTSARYLQVSSYTVGVHGSA